MRQTGIGIRVRGITRQDGISWHAEPTQIRQFAIGKLILEIDLLKEVAPAGKITGGGHMWIYEAKEIFASGNKPL